MDFKKYFEAAQNTQNPHEIFANLLAAKANVFLFPELFFAIKKIMDKILESSPSEIRRKMNEIRHNFSKFFENVEAG